jgi:hypothetical protein
LLLLAAGTVGSAQFLEAEPPCTPQAFLCVQPILAFLFRGAFLVAAGLTAGAALASLKSRLGAAILGGLAVGAVVTVLLLLAEDGGLSPVPLWTISGPAVLVLGLLTVIPLRVTVPALAIVTCVGLVAGVVATLRAPAPGPPGPVGTQHQISDNLAYLQRRDPRPADVAALRPAAGDLDRALQDLRARNLSDDASARQALQAYPTLDGARVHPPPASEKLFDRNTTVVVVLERGSACLIGELGPADESVHLVGRTLDGGCEALYGH